MTKIKIIDEMYDTEQIKDLLLRSDRAVLRGVTAIYDRQMPDEKNHESTLYSNNVGFNAYDSRTLSRYARRIKNGQRMNDSDMSLLRSRIVKYSKQLTKIANDKVDSVQLRWNV